MVDFAAIVSAAARIQPAIYRTPLEISPTRSTRAGRSVWLKLECFQQTGSFKLRGALNALLTLTPAERARGVVTASAGNHGLGLAAAAARTGVRATVVVAETAAPVKIAALRRSGVELLVTGADYAAAAAAAHALADARGAVYIAPDSHPAVIAGGGTIALEILDERPDTAAIVVPAGGGGLIAGVALAAKTKSPGCRVYGVQSTASPSLQAARAAGRIVPVAVQDSLADGLSGNLDPAGPTFALTQRYVDDIFLVEEADIAQAIVDLLTVDRLLVEGAAAVGPAALARGLIPDVGGPIVLILTGRNIAPAQLRQLLPADNPAH